MVPSSEFTPGDGRRRRSRRSRDRIVVAATDLFVERGYVATTIGDVAAAAGLAAQTVYYVFGTKPRLLAAVLDEVIAGDAAEVPVAERPWFPATPGGDATASLAAVVDLCVDLLARVAPIHAVVRAAASDAEVGALLAANRAGRRADQRRIVELFAGSLRRGLGVDAAADVFYGLVNEEVFGLLVDDCGWDLDRFRTWLTDTLTATLLGTR